MVQSDLQTSEQQQASINVDAQQVGSLYAKSLLEVASKANLVAQALDDLDAVVSEVLNVYPKLNEILSSSIVAHEEKIGIIDRVFGGKVVPLVQNFLKVLAERGRLSYLRDVQRIAREMYEQQQGSVRVVVETAKPLQGDEINQITNQLRSMLSAEPVLDLKVSPNLIGGIVLRVGDTVYDGSVATQLKQLRHKIIDRSVHEIQSGRDRFSYPEGN